MRITPATCSGIKQRRSVGPHTYLTLSAGSSERRSPIEFLDEFRSCVDAFYIELSDSKDGNKELAESVSDQAVLHGDRAASKY
jgi:hypothetical protein